MATWANTTFSTAASMSTHESEVNTLTASDWSDKITLAKTIMGNDIQEILVNRGMHYWVDFDDDEILLDTVTNKTIFNITSDYKALELTYRDLSQGDEDTVYGQKSKQYKMLYKDSLKQNLKYIDLDLDLDDETDIYKARLSAVGRQTR